MAGPSTGSVRDEPPHIHLYWRFFFWDVRTDVENFGKHMLNSGGFEPIGTGKKECTVKVTDGKSLDVKFARQRNKKKEGDEKGVPIGLLTADLERKAQKISLTFTPPPDHDAGKPAMPSINSPRDSAKWNGNFQIQLREMWFNDLEIDADGYFVVDRHKFFDNDRDPVDITPAEKTKEGYAMHTSLIQRHARDYGLAPNAYMKIYEREKRRGKPDFQLIELDWQFDVLRPTNEKKYYPKKVAGHYRNKVRKRHRPDNWEDLTKAEKKAENARIDEAHKKEIKELNDSDPDNKRKVWYKEKVEPLARGKFDDPFLVMHITTGNRVESAIWTLSGDAAIHYICCLNGHVIKMVEDSTGCHHAGWKDKSKWRDFEWGGQIAMNKTAIGIEHVGVAGNKWPDDQVRGSARLVQVICDDPNHNIAPVNIMRHRDLGGARSGAHEWGKDCPGNAAPWWIYQERGHAIWPLGLRAGDPATPVPTGEDFFQGVFDLVNEHSPTRKRRVETDGGSKVTTSKGPKGKYINSPLTDPTQENKDKQAAAIAELKGYIEQIGYHPITKNGRNAKDWDVSVMHCVRMCQQRFMIAPNNEGAADRGHGPFPLPLFESHVCRDTAEIIWRVCQQPKSVLPDLKVRT